MARNQHERDGSATVADDRRWLWLLLMALLAVTLAGWAADVAQGQEGGDAGDEGSVRIEATVDRTSLLLGDVLRYDILVQWGSGIETPEIDPGLTLGAFEVLDAEAGPIEDRSPGERQRRIRVQLSTFELGELSIPPVTARYRSADGATTGSIATQPIAIEVRGVAGADQSDDVLDMAGPLDLRRSPWARALVALAIVLALAALAGAIVVWRRRRGAALAAIPVVDTRSIDEIALAELEALARNLPDDEPSAMAFYVRLSEVIRVFLGRRYQVDALDRTTSELLSLLRGRLLPADQLAPLAAFLDDCDLIKFARFPADRLRAAEALNAARRIVLTHRPVSVAQEQTA